MRNLQELERGSQFKITGNVKLYEFPENFSFNDYRNLTENELEKYCVDSGDNLVVDAGLQQICLLLVGSNTNSFTHCGVGSGTNTPAAGDTTLQTEIGRNAINDRYRVGLVAHFDTFFASGDENGSWEETGLFTASSGGTMLCRRKFSSTFTKATTNSAIVAWTITLSAVAD